MGVSGMSEDTTPRGGDILTAAIDPSAKMTTPIPSAVRANVPEGFKLTQAMVFEVKDKKEGEEFIPVCGPLWITGRTNGAHGEWGLVLVFVDHDGHQQTLSIPAGRLHEDAAAMARELAILGLKTIPGREKSMLSYLAKWDVDDRILSAKRLGWLEDKTGDLAFVMPDRVLARDGTREVVYQPERFAPTIRTVHAAHKLEEWQHHVAAPAAKHRFMLFALCAGFSTVFISFAEAGDSFICHFWGTTSRGKTALAQIAASIWGCAADPSDAPSLTFVRRWNFTGNGLEGLAEAHSDLPLVLDELGASTLGDIRPLVYQLSGGQGKAVMNSSREMRAPRSWRTVAISTGEVSLRAKMEDPREDGSRKALKGGLVHRALDVELFDIAAESPTDQRSAVVSGIKASCARYYGTAGPELIRIVAEQFSTMAEAKAFIASQISAVMDEIKPPDALPAETERALRRFALIAVSGIFAAENGVIPANRPEIIAATKEVVDGWLSSSAQTDEQRIVGSVKDFIFRHAARFQPINEPDPEPRVDQYGNEYTPKLRPEAPVKDRVGFVCRATDRWLFTDEGLTEAAPGHDRTTIARALKTSGLLDTSEGKLQTKVTIGTSRPRMYAVKSSILNGARLRDLETAGGEEKARLAPTRANASVVHHAPHAHQERKASQSFQAPTRSAEVF